MLSPDLVEAAGALLQADPARIVALASSLRAPSRLLESTVDGMSMASSLPPQSRIRIELINRARYELGEVIAFLVGSQVVVHRVVHQGRAGAAAGFVLTRGDSRLVPDPPVAYVRILGPVTGLWKDGRWTEVSGMRRRSLRGRILSSLLLLIARSMLYLSPYATAILLARLHRLEGALRRTLARGFRLRELVPRGTLQIR